MRSIDSSSGVRKLIVARLVIITRHEDKGSTNQVRSQGSSCSNRGGFNYRWRNECYSTECHLGCCGPDCYGTGHVHHRNM
eukprot:8030750-Prorocentrum_lima.AAC.1